MFCKYCGSKLTDDAVFCSSCGSRLTNAPATHIPVTPYPDPRVVQYYSMQTEAQRKSELQTIDSLINHFFQKTAQYNRYDELCDLLIQYEKGTPVALVGWGCTLAICGGISSLMFFLMSAYTHNSEFMAMAGLASALLIGGIIMIICGTRKRKLYFRNLELCRNEHSYISQELYNHYLAYSNCPVGMEYSNPYILQALRNTIVSGRADTIKESLNLMIGDSKRNSIEQYLQKIERNTAQSRNIGAIFLASRFFR